MFQLCIQTESEMFHHKNCFHMTTVYSPWMNCNPEAAIKTKQDPFIP